MIKANIETEIAPIVGTEQQAEDLIRYIQESGDRGESIWETNIFGKSIEQLVQDGSETRLPPLEKKARRSCRIPCRKSSTIPGAAWYVLLSELSAVSYMSEQGGIVPCPVKTGCFLC